MKGIHPPSFIKNFFYLIIFPKKTTTYCLLLLLNSVILINIYKIRVLVFTEPGLLRRRFKPYISSKSVFCLTVGTVSPQKKKKQRSHHRYLYYKIHLLSQYLSPHCYFSFGPPQSSSTNQHDYCNISNPYKISKRCISSRNIF